MTSGYQEQVDQMMARVREQAERLTELQQSLARRTVTVRSKDRSVSVVVGAQAEVREITFHTDDYRAMAPAELGTSLVELIARARTQMQDQVREGFGPLMGAGDEIRESMMGGSDVGSLFGELRKLVPQGGFPGIPGLTGPAGTAGGPATPRHGDYDEDGENGG
ncbi:YbaB/EbfC family nucleoid-associated protein [Actinacidiphila yeochonensis]|uniref:YbaB/EbfC family nucleoid-associated protein n=1 Tax=Actinacidiphila yeochonensis TaxID=89050 RepID=UPI00056BBB83|nr:YbaB/EbfC family nucleoid-associated protein [Actinacidiphila yeochonensis]